MDPPNGKSPGLSVVQKPVDGKRLQPIEVALGSFCDEMEGGVGGKPLRRGNPSPGIHGRAR